jgi:hypothetical protein
MPKIISPLFPDHAPRIVTNLLNFSSDGRVRHEGHILPDLTPGVAVSRIYVKAISPITYKIRPFLRAELLALVPTPDNWAARIISHTIGHSRNNWSIDEAAFAALASSSRADWCFAADFANIRAVSIRDTRHTSHNLTAGQAYFHVATGVWRIGVEQQPAQPAAGNANAWAAFMFDLTPVYPDNVMTLGDEAMSLGEEILTL